MLSRVTLPERPLYVLSRHGVREFSPLSCSPSGPVSMRNVNDKLIQVYYSTPPSSTGIKSVVTMVCYTQNDTGIILNARNIKTLWLGLWTLVSKQHQSTAQHKLRGKIIAEGKIEKEQCFVSCFLITPFPISCPINLHGALRWHCFKHTIYLI